MTIFNVISLAGGLALFLYGMSIMGTGLEKYAGGRMESILQKLTSSTWRAVALGAVITALIQSSSGTTVIVVGLVNSGIMQLSQAIGIIMGANIGTTVTGQIIRLSDISGGGMLMEFLKPATFAPILAFVGAVLFVGCTIGKISMEKLTKSLFPFYAAMLAVLMLVTFVPEVVLFIPNLLLT